MESPQVYFNQQIQKCEEKLLLAFEQKDISVLDEIIHEQAYFVLPNGITATKTMVLDNYRHGNTSMASITATDQRINMVGDNAVVSVNLELKGKYHDQVISSGFRYLRVWKMIKDGEWKVISTCGVQLNA